MIKVGQVVSHCSDIWNPKGKLTVVKVTTGKRSGMAIITAKDITGKEFTGCEGIFKPNKI